jgi:nucleotide-binding universal stress UspA family protein
MTRVLIAVDETEDSVRAAQAAHRLFGDTAHYLAVNVADAAIDPASLPWWGAGWGTGAPIGYGAVWPYGGPAAGAPPTSAASGASPHEDNTLDRAAAEARAAADASGLTAAEAIGEVGDPADAIIRAADVHDADVIVVGSHERGWFDRLLAPSVSGEVVKHAGVPVLVVK